MPDLLIIDGSLGEGGGQILRSSLALAAITGRGFRIERIRANRDKPGLRRQHLTSVEALGRICNAQITGAEVGATELTFVPQAVRPGEYTFDIGTAGSTTLVLQTVLPPLLTAAGPSRLTLIGGTHNPGAPPTDFLSEAFLPLVRRMGPRVTVRLERHGFYPAGGGRIVVDIEPVAKLMPLVLHERGPLIERRAKAVVSGLPTSIADRELDVVEDVLDWPDEELEVVDLGNCRGPGNVLTLVVHYEHVSEVFTGFGQRGVSAEQVARGAVDEAHAYLQSDAPVGEHLADQLLLPLALAGAGSFTTVPLSLHSETNMEVIEMFLPVKFKVGKGVGGAVKVSVERGSMSGRT